MEDETQRWQRREANRAKQTNTAFSQPEAEVESDDVVLHLQLGLGPTLWSNYIAEKIRFTTEAPRTICMACLFRILQLESVYDSSPLGKYITALK